MHLSIHLINIQQAPSLIQALFWELGIEQWTNTEGTMIALILHGSQPWPHVSQKRAWLNTLNTRIMDPERKTISKLACVKASYRIILSGISHGSGCSCWRLPLHCKLVPGSPWSNMEVPQDGPPGMNHAHTLHLSWIDPGVSSSSTPFLDTKYNWGHQLNIVSFHSSSPGSLCSPHKTGKSFGFG